MKFLVPEMIWPEGLEELETAGDVEYDPGLWQRREELLRRTSSADALIVRNQTKVDTGLLESGKSLKVIGRLGVGLDNIDLEAANSRDILIVYARNANAVSVAEYVMTAILLRSRDLSSADEDVKRGGWDRKRFTGSEVFGKTLGLVGVGEISRRVARRAAAFGMKTLGYDPYIAPYDYPIVELGIEMVEMETLLFTSDFISVHVPLTPETKDLFSLETFRKMKSGAMLVNASRGGVVNEADLVRSLNEGFLEGAVLDVLEEEPPREDHPLLRNDRVTLTPHIAGLTEEAQANTSALVAREVIKVLRGEKSLCVVN